MWRRFQHGPVSAAETTILIELQRRGLTTYLETQSPWIFDQKADIVAGTWIDFYWADPHRYAVFIDGPHHLKPRQETRDEHVDKALQKRGIHVDRFSYHVPLRKSRLKEICDHIEKVLENVT